MLKDNVANFELTDETLSRHANEVSAINMLLEGLHFLYMMVRYPESRYFSRDEPADAAPIAVRCCAFHWYSVTACNAIKLIGWLHKQQDATAIEPNEYVEAVVPAVYRWRNKVAGH